jgi:hypothetical protein
MDLRPWEGKRLLMLVICSLVMLQTVGEESGFRPHEESLAWMGTMGMGPGTGSERSEMLLLAEKEERQDSVVYRTDPKDGEYERRQWEEREKEKKSWDMLKNMIIDGRQPPRRFSEPPRNGYPQ